MALRTCRLRGRREEVQLLARAGAGDVEEALALCGLAGGFHRAHPPVELLAGVAFALDGGEDAARHGAVADVGGLGLHPGEQLCVGDGLPALERGQQDDVPLQALGAVDGHEVDGSGVDGGGGIEPVEPGGEGGETEPASGLLELVQQGEVGVGVGELLLGQETMRAEVAPGRFHPRGDAVAGAVCERGAQDAVEGRETGDSVVAEEIPAAFNEFQDGDARVACAGEKIEIGEREATPGGSAGGRATRCDLPDAAGRG